MSKTVTIYIDDKPYEVPAGTNIVDVAKFYADNDIPVFCYHPKMEPVGMCRMCLVEMGMEMIDRATGDVVKDDDGNPQIRWFPALQTACTLTASAGVHIRTATEKVNEGRRDILEFLLTSHPLDCPVCDKGGECPLQNLTMEHGPGTSRFNFDDKMHLGKNIPLGELIYLDRERCIQCARCVRFCDELAGDAVLGFHERGRAIQIVTLSDPPFDSYFSGNTTDICPVGALTTADFRFGARSWELSEVASLDPYGPEGANISLSTRLDRDSGGMTVIKRVMPRQNEFVNEIWISDKTRFGHHHSRAASRLTKPLIRKDGELVESTWLEVYAVIAEALKKADGKVGAIAGSMLSNEDLWELRQLVEKAGGALDNAGVWPATMSGADIVQQVGIVGTDKPVRAGEGTVILVVASDLEEEAPVWWLRAKTAGDRGATLITLNARATKLDKYAAYQLNYNYGDAIGALNNLVAKIINGKSFDNDFVKGRAEGFADLQKAVKGERARSGYADPAEAIAKAENLILIVGHEGLNLKQHGELMQAAANLLIVTGHAGKPDNGLIPVWPGANTQGAFDLGYRAEATANALQQQVVFVAGANPFGEDVTVKVDDSALVVAVSMFPDATTESADVVLPRQSIFERDGTFTSGERRVQRFYPAQGAVGEALPDWVIFVNLRQQLDSKAKVKLTASAVMQEISKSVARYAEMSYKNLAHVERQFPAVGGEDLYYGGTAYDNKVGPGVQWSVEAEDESQKLTLRPVDVAEVQYGAGDLLAVPVRVLYDRSPEFMASELMCQRIPEPHVQLNGEDARKQGVEDGSRITLAYGDYQLETVARINHVVPEGVVLVPLRVVENPVMLEPMSVTIKK